VCVQNRACLFMLFTGLQTEREQFGSKRKKVIICCIFHVYICIYTYMYIYKYMYIYTGINVCVSLARPCVSPPPFSFLALRVSSCSRPFFSWPVPPLELAPFPADLFGQGVMCYSGRAPQNVQWRASSVHRIHTAMRCNALQHMISSAHRKHTATHCNAHLAIYLANTLQTHCKHTANTLQHCNTNLVLHS